MIGTVSRDPEIKCGSLGDLNMMFSDICTISPMRIHLNRQKGIEIRLLGKLSTYIKCEILGALVHFNTTLKIDE